ncbi:MAG: transposase [Bdellovibrionales bacterium]|nr:transposase [Bdellovibrionales bacterium]
MANRDLQTNESIKSLKSKVRSERNGNVRDRIRAIVMAVKGLKDREIGDKLGYSIHWVRKWIGRYKKAGIDGLQDGLRTGQPMLLTDEQIFVLYDEILAGPDPSSVLSRYRILDVQGLIKQLFGVEASLSGTHLLMKRMKLSHVKPRPSHPKNNPSAMEEWKKKPKISSRNKSSSTPEKPFRSGSRTKLDLAKKES